MIAQMRKPKLADRPNSDEVTLPLHASKLPESVSFGSFEARLCDTSKSRRYDSRVTLRALCHRALSLWP